MTLSARAEVALAGFHLEVDLTVESGGVLAILGPNGSGKTTLLRCLAGLAPIDRGRIQLGDIVLDEPAHGIFVPPERRPIGVVFQHYLLFEHLSALDNVAFGQRARGIPKRVARDQARELLIRFGLADHLDARPHTLSGGQAQRVAIARALAIEPKMMLLDEPLAALDTSTRRRVRRDLRRDLDHIRGVRILVTHDPIDAYALADRVAVLDHGSIIQQGTMAEITTRPRSRFVADLVGTNLIAGRIKRNMLHIDEGTQLSVVSEFEGPALASIRPRAITVSTTPVDSSARNSLRGVVDELDRSAERVQVGVDGPVRLVAEITAASCDELRLRVGDPVHLAVKATDIETYPA